MFVAWLIHLASAAHKADTERIQELASTVATLKQNAHPAWRVREGWFTINTSDRQEATNSNFLLPFGENELQIFQQSIFKEGGRIVTSWVSDWTPRSELAKFDTFTITNSWSNAQFSVVVKPGPNESISMKFAVTFIVE